MRSKNDQGKMPPPRLALAAEPAKRAPAENDAHPATRTPRPSYLAPRPLHCHREFSALPELAPSS